MPVPRHIEFAEDFADEIAALIWPAFVAAVNFGRAIGADGAVIQFFRRARQTTSGYRGLDAFSIGKSRDERRFFDRTFKTELPDHNRERFDRPFWQFGGQYQALDQNVQ